MYRRNCSGLCVSPGVLRFGCEDQTSEEMGCFLKWAISSVTSPSEMERPDFVYVIANNLRALD